VYLNVNLPPASVADEGCPHRGACDCPPPRAEQRRIWYQAETDAAVERILSIAARFESWLTFGTDMHALEAEREDDASLRRLLDEGDS
jgi:hypothetical protein